LQQLTDRQRDVLRLRYEQGHTMPQVAKILGVEVRAAEKLIARALTTLRTRLSDLREKL
jgi:RNA polymerase sigma factor (sigma-70 family)